jgi:hypothetical protein
MYIYIVFPPVSKPTSRAALGLAAHASISIDIYNTCFLKDVMQQFKDGEGGHAFRLKITNLLKSVSPNIDISILVEDNTADDLYEMIREPLSNIMRSKKSKTILFFKLSFKLIIGL